MIEFQPAVDDYVATEVFRLRQNLFPGRARLFWVYVLLTLAVGLLFVRTSLNGGGVMLALLGVVFAACALLTVLLSRRYRIHALRKGLHRLLTHNAHEYLCPIRAIFDREGFECRSPTECRSRRWDSVERLVCFGDHFLFTNGDHITLNVPKRAFAGEEEAARFLGMIQAYIPVADS